MAGNEPLDITSSRYCGTLITLFGEIRDLMRRTFVTIIVCAFAFFAVGWAAVKVGWMSQSVYLTTASLIGTFASVMGLIALSRPALTTRDLQDLEVENLSRLAESTANLKALESKRSKAQTEIEELTRTRAEMDTLVRQAATSLFLREEIRRLEDRIDKHLQQQPNLASDLQDYEEQRRKLVALNEEIQAHKDVDLLIDITRRIRLRPDRMRDTLYQTLDQIWLIGPIMKLYIQLILMQRDRSRLRQIKELRSSRALETTNTELGRGDRIAPVTLPHQPVCGSAPGGSNPTHG